MKQPEIINILHEIKTDVAVIKTKTLSIEVQTIETNGRVTQLEHWRQRIKGAWGALTIIGVLAGSILGWLIKHYLG